MNKGINIKDYSAVRNTGINALVKDLGITGAINFIRQFDMGYGDYTKERVQMDDDRSVVDIVNEIKKRRVQGSGGAEEM